MSRTKHPRRARGLVLAAGIGAAAGATAVVRASRRWEATADPTGGGPLAMPAVTESTVRTADGAELAVAVAGAAHDGPVIVLSHCWMGDRRVWGPVAERLADRHRVVLYDHRGHGRSTVGHAGLTLDALADDLRAVLEHIDARDAVIAGHSMGGMTAQAFAVRHPDVLRERVAGLVLVATACDQLRARGGLSPRTLGLPIVDRLLARPHIGRLLVRNTVGATAVASHLDALTGTILATDPHVRVALLEAMQAMDLRAGLAAVDLPVVILSGDRDQVTRPELSRRMATALPQARLVDLPGLGHMLPWEAPDRVAETVSEAATAAALVGAPAI